MEATTTEESVCRQAGSDGDPCSQCYSMHPCTKFSSVKSCRQCYSLNPCDQACSRIYGRKDGDDLTAKCGAECCSQCYSLNPCDQACSLIYQRKDDDDQYLNIGSETRSGQDNNISPVEHRDEDHKRFLETNSEEQEVKETLDETKTASSNSKDRPLNLKGCNADIVVTILRQENELLRRRTNNQQPNNVDVASDNETIEPYIISYMCPNLTHEEAECHSSMRQDNAQKNRAHPTNSENVTQPQNPEICAQPQNPENGAQPLNPENFLVSNPLYVPRIPKQAANGLPCRHMNVVASVAILCAMLITCCLFIGLYINTNIQNSQKALADSGGFGGTRLTSTSGNMQEATMSAISNSSQDDSLYDRRFKSLKLAKCVTSDKEGNIITAEGVGVHVYNHHTGRLLFRILWKAKGMGIDYPQGVYRDSLGNIIIGSVAHRVDMYRYNGTYVRTVVEVRLPWDIAVGPDGQLVVTTRKTKNLVTIFPRHTLMP
uniref:Uncharacterized protein n=1 Tax=Branchiostoma floridae TaxID=7739 RepID=C3YJN4_BRAFL|eukprot:XP_002603330.1 hypothetical protein BRAFLDRAFT_71377 [Branchiostoma floridae]